MTTFATHWQKHGMRVAVAEVLPALGMCRIRIASAPDSHGWVAMLDPKTGGPRGYAPVPEVPRTPPAPTLCDCTGAPHHWEQGCPVYAEEVTT